jgi:pyruvate/2-oxoglutarate dehydrogenase complex dihydrolipoamide dehydrogenase (E3) component
VDAECKRYDEIINTLGPIDIQVLGMGHNGHIGFNEPDDHFPLGTHKVDLTQSTIDANARFFASADEVPRQALTMGIKTIMQAKKVLVVGGGVAGMKAAVTAAERGHNVILCEKTDALGGILKSEQAVPFKYEMYQLSLSLAKQMEREGVDIRLNTPVTAEMVEQIAPDAMILAVGSNPIVPPLPGMDGKNVIIVNDYYLRKDEVADDVVVLGGGLAGCECAVHLGMEGKKVHLVEMRDSLAVDCNIRHRPILMKHVDQYVTVHTGCQGMKVTEEGLICRNAEGEEILIPGKTVICAVGQRSNRAAVEELRYSAPWVREIGDCNRVANITNAIYQGYHAALDI